MVTKVVVYRELFGHKIGQNSKSEFFNLTDLVSAGNNWRSLKKMSLFNFQQWLGLISTKEFIQEMESKFGKVLISKRGRKGGTWGHPFIFIDLALAINPKLKVEVYDWMYDQLIKYRNESGDSYRKMCGSLWVNMRNKSRFQNFIKQVAILIKAALDVDDWNTCSEEILKKRDKIHENIALLSEVLQNNKRAVIYGINKTLNLNIKE